MKFLGLISVVLALSYRAQAGFPDITVENIKSASGLHQSGSSTIVATAYTVPDPDSGYTPQSVDLGTTTRKLDFSHQAVIEITFRLVGASPKPLSYTVEWFFIAEDKNTREEWVFDYGSKPITSIEQIFDVASLPVAEHRRTSVSTSLAGTQTDYNGNIPVSTSTTHSASGAKIEGWIVRLRENGKVIKDEASLSELKDAANTHAVATMLDGIILESQKDSN